MNDYYSPNFSLETDIPIQEIPGAVPMHRGILAWTASEKDRPCHLPPPDTWPEIFSCTCTTPAVKQGGKHKQDLSRKTAYRNSNKRIAVSGCRPTSDAQTGHSDKESQAAEGSSLENNLSFIDAATEVLYSQISHRLFQHGGKKIWGLLYVKTQPEVQANPRAHGLVITEADSQPEACTLKSNFDDALLLAKRHAEYYAYSQRFGIHFDTGRTTNKNSGKQKISIPRRTALCKHNNSSQAKNTDYYLTEQKLLLLTSDLIVQSGEGPTRSTVAETFRHCADSAIKSANWQLWGLPDGDLEHLAGTDSLTTVDRATEYLFQINDRAIKCSPLETQSKHSPVNAIIATYSAIYNAEGGSKLSCEKALRRHFDSTDSAKELESALLTLSRQIFEPGLWRRRLLMSAMTSLRRLCLLNLFERTSLVEHFESITQAVDFYPSDIGLEIDRRLSLFEWAFTKVGDNRRSIRMTPPDAEPAWFCGRGVIDAYGHSHSAASWIRQQLMSTRNDIDEGRSLRYFYRSALKLMEMCRTE